MAWDDELIPLLRQVINDVSGNDFSDSSLTETLVAAAQFVQQEADFDTDYTMDMDQITITPDPTTGTRDENFINLTILKAGMILSRSELKTHSKNSISFKDGPASIDTKSRTTFFQDLYKQAKQDYEEALVQFQAGNSRAGHAILTPYTDGTTNVIQGHFT